MADLNDLNCKIYLDSSYSRSELTKLVARILSARVEGNTVSGEFGEIDVRNNDEFDSRERRRYPDGFLHFAYILEVYAASNTEVAECRRAVAGLLETLWSERIPAIAACDYEHDLPGRGGYNNTALRWPL